MIYIVCGAFRFCLFCTLIEAAGIMRSICLAINHLHNMNIVHRDIKVSDTSCDIVCIICTYTDSVFYTYACKHVLCMCVCMYVCIYWYVVRTYVYVYAVLEIYS